MNAIQCSCGAPNSIQAKSCWLCQRDLSSIRTVRAEVVSAQVIRRPSSQPPLPPTNGEMMVPSFILSTLLVTVMLLLVIVAIGLVAPGLGILAAILLLPALVNSRAYIIRRQLQHQTFTPIERILVFFASVSTFVAIALVSLVVAFVTFFVVCFGGIFARGPNGDMMSQSAFIAFGVTALTGLLVAIFAWHFSERK